MKFDYAIPAATKTKKKEEKLVVEVRPPPANSIVNALSEESRKIFEKDRRHECLRQAREFAKTLFVRLPDNLKKELLFYFQVMERSGGGPRGRRKLINIITKMVFESIIDIRRLDAKMQKIGGKNENSEVS